VDIKYFLEKLLTFAENRMQVSVQKQFLSGYEKYIRELLFPTNNELKQFFHKWRNPEHWVLASRLSRLPSPSPIQRTHTRIKRPESVVDKILRNPSSFPEGLCLDSVKNMKDTLGGRIVVYFLSNLPLIDKELRNSADIEISSANPPIAYLNQDILDRFKLNHFNKMNKESGYTALHYIVRLRSSKLAPEVRPWFEIQVRTIAEDLWSEIEHVLGYKPNKKTSFAVRKQFQIISSQLTTIDEHFNLLYEELSRFQEEILYRDESPLNAENLPAVLNELNIGCAQKEIDGLLKMLVSRRINTVGDLRAEATPEKMEIIKTVYTSDEGRQPNNFEIVACIATTRGITENNEMKEVVKSQIDFLKAWEKIKKDSYLI